LDEIKIFTTEGTEEHSYRAMLATTTLTRLAVEIEDTVAHLRLQNPPLNVIDIPMMEELSAALADVESQPNISVITLSGSQKAFSVGVDVAAHTPDKVEAMLAKFHAVIRVTESDDRHHSWSLSGRRS